MDTPLARGDATAFRPSAAATARPGFTPAAAGTPLPGVTPAATPAITALPHPAAAPATSLSAAGNSTVPAAAPAAESTQQTGPRPTEADEPSDAEAIALLHKTLGTDDPERIRAALAAIADPRKPFERELRVAGALLRAATTRAEQIHAFTLLGLVAGKLIHPENGAQRAAFIGRTLSGMPQAESEQFWRTLFAFLPAPELVHALAGEIARSGSVSRLVLGRDIDALLARLADSENPAMPARPGDPVFLGLQGVRLACALQTWRTAQPLRAAPAARVDKPGTSASATSGAAPGAAPGAESLTTAPAIRAAKLKPHHHTVPTPDKKSDAPLSGSARVAARHGMRTGSSGGLSAAVHEQIQTAANATHGGVVLYELLRVLEEHGPAALRALAQATLIDIGQVTAGLVQQPPAARQPALEPVLRILAILAETQAGRTNLVRRMTVLARVHQHLASMPAPAPEHARARARMQALVVQTLLVRLMPANGDESDRLLGAVPEGPRPPDGTLWTAACNEALASFLNPAQALAQLASTALEPDPVPVLGSAMKMTPVLRTDVAELLEVTLTRRHQLDATYFRGIERVLEQTCGVEPQRYFELLARLVDGLCADAEAGPGPGPGAWPGAIRPEWVSREFIAQLLDTAATRLPERHAGLAALRALHLPGTASTPAATTAWTRRGSSHDPGPSSAWAPQARRAPDKTLDPDTH